MDPYYYYHCTSACGIRYKATDINGNIGKVIKEYVLPLPELQLYKEIIISKYNERTASQRQDIKDLRVQIEEVNKKLSNTRDLLLSGEIQG